MTFDKNEIELGYTMLLFAYINHNHTTEWSASEWSHILNVTLCRNISRDLLLEEKVDLKKSKMLNIYSSLTALLLGTESSV